MEEEYAHCLLWPKSRCKVMNWYPTGMLSSFLFSKCHPFCHTQWDKSCHMTQGNHNDASASIRRDLYQAFMACNSCWKMRASASSCVHEANPFMSVSMWLELVRTSFPFVTNTSVTLIILASWSARKWNSFELLLSLRKLCYLFGVLFFWLSQCSW